MKLKRIFSFILALATVFSLLPSMTFVSEATEVPESKVYEYKFNYKALNGTGNIKIYDSKNPESDGTGVRATGDGTAPWTFLGQRSMNGGNFLAESMSYTVRNTDGSNIKFPNNAMAIAVEVGEAGIYYPSITVATGPDRQIATYYLVKSNEEALSTTGEIKSYLQGALASATPLGKIDCYAEAKGTKTESFAPIMLEAGTYNFVMMCNETNPAVVPLEDKGNTFITHEIKALKLAGLSSLDATADKTALALGETANITTKATFADATVSDLDAAAVTYNSSDEAVATVSDAGVVTTAEAGTADITVTYGDLSDTVTITVLDIDNGNAGVTLTYNTTFSALSGDKLPATEDSTKWKTEVCVRDSGNGIILMNESLMNSDTEVSVDKEGNAVEPWRLMDLNKTDPWDLLAPTQSQNGVRIHSVSTKPEYMNLTWDTSRYGAYNSKTTLLPIRISVSNKGKYTLSIKSVGETYGVVPAVYVFPDDGTITDSAGIIAMIDTPEEREALRIGYHNFSTVNEGYQMVGHFTADERGDYFVVFHADDTATAKNGTTETSGNFVYQDMKLQGIQLTEYDSAKYDPITWRSASLTLEDIVETNYYINPNTAVLGQQGFVFGEDTAYLEYRTGSELTAPAQKIAFTECREDLDKDGVADYTWKATIPVPAKKMADVQYVRACAVVGGETFYTEVKEYSPQTYAKNKLSDETLKLLMVALMDYGAKAQVQFNYNAGALMNSFIQDDDRTGLAVYDDGMLTACKTDLGKLAFTADSRIVGKSKTLELEGNVNINIYYNITDLMTGATEAKLLYWNEADYDSLETLSADNCSGSFDLAEKNGAYFGRIDGIAAKELGNTYYACVYIKNGETDYYGGITSYSAHQYAINQIASSSSTETLKELCKAMAVYSNAAKTYFAS